MSAEEEITETNGDENESKVKKAGKYDSSAADLEKVTDFVEETEIAPQDIGEVTNV